MRPLGSGPQGPQVKSSRRYRIAGSLPEDSISPPTGIDVVLKSLLTGSLVANEGETADSVRSMV